MALSRPLTGERATFGWGIFLQLTLGIYLAPCSCASAIEPEHKIGNWFGATSALRYSDDWSLFLQGELRTWEPVQNLNELPWRVAGHYDVNKTNMVAAG